MPTPPTRSILLSLSPMIAASVATPLPQDGPEKVSEFGRYEGYSEALFDEWVTSSLYVEMRDGVQLAVDVTRPAVDGVAVEEPFPVVWTHSRYHRNFSSLMRRPGTSMVDVMEPLQLLVRHGYVVAAAGVRGSGASFGRFEGLFSEAETKDAAEIIAWLASQPWSDGNVGMYGGSYLGITQYMAASLDPPALKAIFPDVALFDVYDVLHPGGVFREDMMEHWDGLTRTLDLDMAAPAVDADTDGELLRAAMAEHEDNWDVLGNYGDGNFRDHATESLTYAEHGPSTCLEEIRAAKVPAYHINGWFDVFVLDATLWFANYEGPQRLAIGAWSHAGMPDPALMAERTRLTAVEQHRWFDRWLKGIENGVEDGPRVQYAVMEEPGSWHWRSSETWPPPEAQPTRFWFAGGPSESVESVNDGRLSSSRPTEAGVFDDYPIDPTTTTGTSSRWDNAVGAGQMRYSGLADNDRKALTYTSDTLEEDVLVVGHPVVTLVVTATAGDADFHVLLEEVDENGEVRYVTEGVLRGSLRALSDAPWNNLGLPYQRSFRKDRKRLPADEPTEVVMDLHPTANVFDAGHCMRVVVMGADADNTITGPVEPPAEVRVFRGATHASSMVLPIVRSAGR